LPIAENIKKRMVSGSWIRRIFEEGPELIRKHGAHNVFDLSIGNPVMDPPPEVRHHIKRLLETPPPGLHRYMENAGYQETREAVAKQVSLENAVKATADDIVMTVGAAGALNIILKTILNPGDEVIALAPYFMEYDNYVDNHGGVPRAIQTDENFLPDLSKLESSINRKTRAVIINSPNNPTGVVYDEKLVRQIGQLLSRMQSKFGRPIYLISDEAYSSLIYDGLKYVPIFQAYNRSIIATSHSKDLSLPGERIGYVAVHPEIESKEDLMHGLIFCNRILGFVNAPALMQNIVKHLQHITVPIADYQSKRDFMYNSLVHMGYEIVKPQGAFYMFPKTPIDDDIEFVKLLQEHNVLTVPGRGFGMPGYFRIAYCVPHKTLEGSLFGFRKAAEQFRLS